MSFLTFYLSAVAIVVGGYVLLALGDFAVCRVNRTFQRRLNALVDQKVKRVLDTCLKSSGYTLQFGPLMAPVFAPVAVFDVEQVMDPVREVTVFDPMGVPQTTQLTHAIHATTGDKVVLTVRPYWPRRS